MTLLYALHKRGGGRGGEEEESLHGAQYHSSTEREQRRCLTGSTSMTDSVRYFQLSCVWLNRLVTMITIAYKSVHLRLQ